MPMKPAPDIDAYISTFPKEVQVRLNKLRSTIRKVAPDAEEAISYGIPTFKLNGNLVHFGGFSGHIGFYPGPDGILEFKKELSVYEVGKGSVQFPLDEPLPLDLISRIVGFRVEQNKKRKTKKKAAAKTTKAAKMKAATKTKAAEAAAKTTKAAKFRKTTRAT